MCYQTIIICTSKVHLSETQAATDLWKSYQITIHSPKKSQSKLLLNNYFIQMVTCENTRFLVLLFRYSWSKTPLKFQIWLSLLVDFAQFSPLSYYPINITDMLYNWGNIPPILVVWLHLGLSVVTDEANACGGLAVLPSSFFSLKLISVDNLHSSSCVPNRPLFWVPLMLQQIGNKEWC